MITPAYVRLMARYGQWQNDCIIRAASELTEAQRTADEGLFFGSLMGTLNHLLWGDQLWMSRLAGTAAPETASIQVSTTLHQDWLAYVEDRRNTDHQRLQWARNIQAHDTVGELSWYSQSQGRTVVRDRALLVVQMFNHGTHHRGQVHAVLTRYGVSTQDTDVPFLPDLADGTPI